MGNHGQSAGHKNGLAIAGDEADISAACQPGQL
jgi:hypothetical protein